MKPTRKLRLDREPLHELTNEDLGIVAGGTQTDPSHTGPQCMTCYCTHLCPPSEDTTCPTGGCTYRELCDPHV